MPLAPCDAVRLTRRPAEDPISTTASAARRQVATPEAASKLVGRPFDRPRHRQPSAMLQL
ncbi:hypothetical protein [Chenggangzhangella methanolivorans]|uniref:Uncharacterized protein n=1 Tax=Chenggangzhangella methanolivorans TaxID=1437009 RepID=A0A9E6RE94_9HYPH|nr:hypothetical protein [Chenggangzhangella methanolivorans]QZN99585.1 hypothetical protein K6K41_23245 [Chenggangzhangella methanolivorans]